jgi:superoxide dismutase, Fe-Mn family
MRVPKGLAHTLQEGAHGLRSPHQQFGCRYAPSSFNIHYTVAYQYLIHVSIPSGTKHESKSLDEVVRDTGRDASESALHHNAAQLWNHNFMWKTVTPVEKNMGEPLRAALQLQFGSEDRFKSRFMQHAMAVFGSGYTWLVDNDGQLQVVNTFNGQTVYGRPRVTPLLVCDVWEHAYYTDFEDRRLEYLNNWWKIIDWEFVETEYLKIDRASRFPASARENNIPWKVKAELNFAKKDHSVTDV